MTSCTHCGTQNRAGSKFCSKCGARLIPQSGLICPMCGTANKLESVFCANCGARLAPLIAAPAADKPAPPAAPIKGLSLPAKPYDPTADVVEEPKPDESAETDDDWVARLRENQTEQASVVEDEDLPNWLRFSPQPSEVNQPKSKDEQPSWLRSFPAEPDPMVEPTSEIPGAEIPDWLKAPTVPVEPIVSTEPPPPTLPVQEPIVESAPLAPATSEELPAWVKELGSSAIQSAEESLPAHLAAKTESATPFEPLIEALEEKTASRTQSMSAPAIAIEGVEEIPDWLRTAAPTESAADLQTAFGEIQPAITEQVPDWIAALKPVEQPASLENEPVETIGPLAGFRGVLPLAIAIAEPRASTKPPTLEVRKESAAIFDSLLAAPTAETTLTGKTTRRAWTMRPLIYLLLALAVVIPFFLPSDWASSAIQIYNTPTSELYDTIQSVPANSTVLLAFEYDLSVAGEMNLQAKAIARHLIQRNVKIITLSTLETGAPIAKQIIDDAARGKNYTPGVNYAHLGFLAGHEAGLANLAATGLSSPALGVKTLRDLQLIVLFAGTDGALKAWMEQVQPRLNVKIAAGVSAAVEPKARAYRDTPSRQLIALTSGLVGAAQYEVLSKPEETGLALVSVNAQTAAQFVLVFIILLGNLAHWLTRGQRRNG